MKPTRLLAVLFILLLAPTTQAETPLMVDSAWYVVNHNYFTNMVSHTYGHEKDMLEFPEEIDSDARWLGATITDGNEIWAVILLPLQDEETLSKRPLWDFLLKGKLRANAVIAAVFPEGDFQIRKWGNEAVALYSPGLDLNDTVIQNVLPRVWHVLKEKSYFSFIRFYPERTLLPILPPEQEEESAFIKKVRQRSAEDYKEGKYAGTEDSVFWGLTFAEDGAAFILEVTNDEGASTASDTEPLPFQFGGFVNPDAIAGVALRWERETFENLPIGIKVGTRALSPEERGDSESKHRFKLSFIAPANGYSPATKEGYGENYHQIRGENNISIFYPKQAENRPDEEGVLSNEELDKINGELARDLLEIILNIQQSLLSLDPPQPVDFAFSVDDEEKLLYFACVYPSDKIDVPLALQYAHTWIDHFQQINPDDDFSKLFEGWNVQTEMITADEPETAAGITVWLRILINVGDDDPAYALIGYAPERVYAVVRPSDDSDGVSDEQIAEQFDTMRRQLVLKINDSHQAVAEKTAPPTTVFHSKVEGCNLRLDYMPSEYGYRWAFHVGEDSIGTAVSLLVNFGKDYLPFLRGE